MNLTVKVKIIGGFVIMFTLLAVISGISLLNLSSISDSTQQQNTLAIPTLKASNKLALELSQMSNLTLKGYYQEDLALLADELKNYKSIEKIFTQQLSDLKRIVASEQKLLTNLTQVDQLYTNFHNAGNSLFKSHKTSLEQKHK
ncbi:MAG: methyl-accepting chemotaxis protein, partial [Alteromonadales bacterium]|nr:methyl-accepting chemotaxis protein [Alteromonadales bacterium]